MTTFESWSRRHFSTTYTNRHLKDITIYNPLSYMNLKQYDHSQLQISPQSRKGDDRTVVDLVWKDATTTKRAKPTAKMSTPNAPEIRHLTSSAQMKQHTKEIKFVTAQVGPKRRKRTKAPYASRNDVGLFSKFTLETQAWPVANIKSLAKSPESLDGSAGSSATTKSTHSSPEEPDRWDQGSWSGVAAEFPVYDDSVFPPDELPVGTFDAAQYVDLHTPVVEELPTLAFGTSPGSPITFSAIDGPKYDDPVDSEDVLEILRHVPAGITYQNLAHKYHAILESYDTDYCVVPLSTDCPSNPFRVSSIFIEKYPFLLHGVLAISARHLAKRDKSVSLENQAHDHWSTSLQLLSTATYSNSDFLPMLDTVLVLANFESMQSAYNMVNMHLDGARKMIQEAGLTEWSHYSPRLRAQIAMLVWWDVTVSLIARRRPRLPSSYMEILVGYDGDGSDGWSSFTLNGCPLAFITAMSKLATLAAIFEQTKQMEHTIFDRSAVDAITRQVEEYTDTSHSLEADGAIDVDTVRNRHHCIEAWRNAILLFSQRVFYSEPTTADLDRITHLSRLIFDSARCIPPTETLQKQLLLPVFLAASETGNEWQRDFAREFCRHWNRVSNFDQFETVGRLLEDIWAGWTDEGRSVYWWGVKVPAAGSGGGEAPLTKMLQLG